MNNQKYQSLHTIRKIGILKAVGSLFCNEISNKYDNRPPQLLNQILSQEDLTRLSLYLNRLNSKINQYWPCSFAYWCGYICAPFTVGISLCIPNICVSQTEAVLLQQIKKINHNILRPKKLEMSLVKGCWTSHLLIQQVDIPNSVLN